MFMKLWDATFEIRNAIKFTVNGRYSDIYRMAIIGYRLARERLKERKKAR